MNDEEDLEAHIHVESEYKKGSNFWFYIDVTEDGREVCESEEAIVRSTLLDIPLEDDCESSENLSLRKGTLPTMTIKRMSTHKDISDNTGAMTPKRQNKVSENSAPH